MGSSVPRQRRPLRIALGLLLGLVLAEGALRVVHPSFNLAKQWCYHPVLGWSQVPGGRFHYTIDGETVWVGFNAEGFHDKDHAFAKPPGVKRIVLLGDSFSEALQVNLEQAFFSILERELNATGGQRWELINLGVGDFGNAQAWIALHEYGLRYAPDLVLLQLFPINDVLNNSIELAGLYGSNNDGYRPYLVERDGGLELAYTQPARAFLRRHSTTFGVAEWFLRRFFPANDAGPRQAGRRALGLPEVDATVWMLAAEEPPAITRAWAITDKIIQRIVRECREHGLPMLPVVIPWDQCVGRAYAAFAASAPLPLVADAPEQRLSRLFDRLQVPVVLMKPSLDAHQDECLPARGGHLNPAGHRLVAEAILRALREHGWAR